MLIRTMAIAAAIVALPGIYGCVQNPVLQSGPEPRVANCALIRQATPSEYFCNGKTYTAVQLSEIRNGTAPSANQ